MTTPLADTWALTQDEIDARYPFGLDIACGKSRGTVRCATEELTRRAAGRLGPEHVATINGKPVSRAPRPRHG